MAKNLPWTKEIALSVSRDYTSKSIFQREQSSLYKFAYRRGWWKEMSSHMTAGKAKPRIWDEDSIRKAASEVSVKKDFQIKYPGAYAAARRIGIIIDVCSHMERRILPCERILGRNCSSCGEFIKAEDISGRRARCKSCETARVRDYNDKNRGWKRSMTAKRRARLAKASPAWLTEEQLNAIKEIYAHASLVEAQTGIKHEVDHMVPISGKNVCGLHVPWNLSVIPMSENRRKSNKASML